MITRSPTWIGSRKSTRSTEAVTHGIRAWRNAAIPAVVSIIARTTPPNTWPKMFASWGIMRREVSPWDSLTGLDARSGSMLNGWFVWAGRDGVAAPYGALVEQIAGSHGVGGGSRLRPRSVPRLGCGDGPRNARSAHRPSIAPTRRTLEPARVGWRRPSLHQMMRRARTRGAPATEYARSAIRAGYYPARRVAYHPRSYRTGRRHRSCHSARRWR